MKIEIPYLKGQMKCVLMPDALQDGRKWYILIKSRDWEKFPSLIW